MGQKRVDPKKSGVKLTKREVDIIAIFKRCSPTVQQRLLEELPKIMKKRPTPKCKVSDCISVMEELIGERLVGRKRIVVEARYVLSEYLYRKGLGECRIGHALGKDHSTIHYYLNIMRAAKDYPLAYESTLHLKKQFLERIKDYE